MRSEPSHSTVATRASSVAAMIGVMTALSARSLHAGEDAPLRLTFVGAPGCDDELALVREVERRAPAVRFTDSSGAPTAISVRIVGAGKRIHSILFIERTGEPAATRAITGRDCQELLAGTALVIAVVISRKKPSDSATPLPPEEIVGRVPAPSVETPSDRLEWRFGGGVAGTLIQGIAPGPLPGLDAFFDAKSQRRGWSPALRLGFRYAGRSGFSAGDARASFSLASGFAAACPAAWFFARDWALRPCASASLASLRASGSNVEGGRSERHPFGGVGGVLRLEVRFASALSLEFETGAEVALTESRFRFGDDVFHETSPLTGRLSLGFSAHTP